MPARGGAPTSLAPVIYRGAARFNYGSTVIVLLPPDVAELAAGPGPESPVKLGQALARRR